MKLRQINSNVYPIPFLLINSADHINGLPAISPLPTVTLRKNGSGSFVAAQGAVTEIGNGWYELAANAEDRNTLGALIIHVVGTGADPFDDPYTIVSWNPFDMSGGFENLHDFEIIPAQS